LLIRITWALVAVGFALLLGGFFMDDQNILLILAIAVELVAIILVLASWARRAKDAADAYEQDLSFGSATDDTEEDDELLETFADEEFAVGGRQSSRPATKRKPAKKPAARKTAAKSTTSTAAKRKPAAKSKPAASKAKAKPKPAARKPAKPKPQRRKPTAG
jgi:FtsZ-interacting cell division protein ZipA